MADFLLTATDRSDKRETVCIQAEDSQAAWRQLESQGYRDITLHTSDVESPPRFAGLDDGHLTPADLVELRVLSRLGFCWFIMRRLYSKSRWAVACLILVNGLNWWIAGSPGILGVIAMALLSVPLFLAVWASFFGISYRYNRLVEAQAWGRWHDVLRQAPALRNCKAAFDVGAREACALAGLGRVEEALRKVEEQQAVAEVPRWMYFGRLAEVYNVAQRHEEALACSRQAYENAPQNAAAQLAFAFALLRSERDLARAKQLIAAAESQHLSDLLLAMLPYAQGLAALNSDNPAEARRLFLLAEQRLAVFAAASPAVGPVLEANRAYLAIALVKLGDRAGAEEQYRRARRRLVALKATRLLERVDRALAAS